MDRGSGRAAMRQLTPAPAGATGGTMFRRFEQLLLPTEIPPEAPPPQLGEERALLRFYWHYARQARWLIGALFVTGLAVATFDTMIPAFMGRVVTLLTTHTPATLLARCVAAVRRHGGGAAGRRARSRSWRRT